METLLGGRMMNRKNMVQEDTAYVNTVSTLNQQKIDDTFFDDDEIQFNIDLDTIINSYIFDDEVAR